MIDCEGQLQVNGVKETRLNKPIKAAITGRDGSRFALDADGKLWTWGGNSNGHLGQGDTNARDVPTMVQALKAEKVKQFSVYWNRVACTTEDNKAFVWGNCEAFGLSSKETTPTELNRRTWQISVGHSHSLMLDEGNAVFAIESKLW